MPGANDRNATDEESQVQLRCDFCQSPVPTDPVTLVYEGVDYRFCTHACRHALEEREHVFTQYRGHRFVPPGVAALDAKLPRGMPRNAMVLVSAQPGTRKSDLLTELAWRTLRRDEPVVYVTFQEPHISLIERFLTLEWNVLPYLESGAFHILDCFTYRVEDRERMFSRMNDWNAHLHEVAAPEVTPVRDPTDVSEVETQLDRCTDGRGMVDRGMVVIDSLTEFGSLVQPVRAYNFVKDIRADVCKGRFVPIIAGAAYLGDAEQFPHDLEYMFDGIIDLEHNPKIVEDALIKRLRVRKMSGVLTYPEWIAFEYTSTDGLVMYDPAVELEQSRTGSESDPMAESESTEPADHGMDDDAGETDS